jgi:ribonuclease HI
MLPIVALKSQPPTRVSELIDHTSSTWKNAVLDQHFLPADIEVIKSIPLSTAPQEDFWAWQFEKTGMFSVRTAYRALVHTKKVREDWLEGRQSSSSSTSEQKLWSKMWKTKVPSKIRVFLWRLSHQSIPTGSVRHRRNMAVTPECCFCHAAEDDWRHSLIDCAMARSVWALIDEELVEHISINSGSNAKRWIFLLMESLTHAQFIQTAVTLWAIWSARRKAIHEEIFQSPYSIYKFICNFLDDLNLVTTSSQSEAPACQPRQNVPRWIPPADDYMKINVDAAVSRKESRGVVAAICRKPDGTYLGSSVLACPGINDPATLEAIACREGLALAADLQLNTYIIASDCKEVILSMKTDHRACYSTVLKEIKERRFDLMDVRFIHEGRSSNVHAHNLARNSLDLLQGRRLWLLNSPDIDLVPLRASSAV